MHSRVTQRANPAHALCRLMVFLLVFTTPPGHSDTGANLSRIEDQFVRQWQQMSLKLEVDNPWSVRQIQLPNGPEHARVLQNGDGSFSFIWTPKRSGTFPVVVAFAGRAYSQVDFNVHVSETDNQTRSRSGEALPAHRHQVPLNANFSITRLTDESAFKFDNGAATHKYSKRQAWNINESLLDVGDKIIDAGTFGIRFHNIPLSSERVWSHTATHEMYGIQFRGNKSNLLVKHDLATGQTFPVYEFSGFSRCRIGDGEGNTSNDDVYALVICTKGNGGKKTALSVDLTSGLIIGRLELDHDYNWGGFSQTGNYIVIEYNAAGNASRRLVRYSPWLTDPLLLTTHVEHGDLGIDNEGSDVYAMIDGHGVHYVRLYDGARVFIGSGGDATGARTGHISCRSYRSPGYCFYSSRVTGKMGTVELRIDYSKPGKSVGSRYYHYTGANNILLWGSSNSSAHNYHAQPKASISPTGRRAVFSSDWQRHGNSYAFEIRRR